MAFVGGVSGRGQVARERLAGERTYLSASAE